MNTSRPIRVLIAEDHGTVRQALKLLVGGQPDMVIAGGAPDGTTAVAMALELAPDVVVLDISLPLLDGLSVARSLRAADYVGAILALTAHEDSVYVHEMLRAGAAGYVLKRSAAGELLQAIRTVAGGGQFLDSVTTARLTATLTQPDARSQRQPTTLAGRESAVLRFIASGYTIKEIAAELHVSVKTIEADKARAMRALQLRDRIDIVRYAVIQGWLRDLAAVPTRLM
jgi:DNA-binding NarL/FixJ family response regulator